MNRYFLMQSKRLGKSLPGALLAALVLLGSLFAVFSLTVLRDAQKTDNQKLPVALVGEADEPFLQMGLQAMTAFDSSRFSVDIRQMELEEAKKALQMGQIAAYVQIPESFIDEALHGKIQPLTFVSTTGAAGLVSIFKEEITDMISDVLLAAQKGVYGMADAAGENGLSVGNNMDRMAIRYVEFVFSRDKLYSLEKLGIADSLGLEGYMLCGLGVLFLLLCCLPFAPIMIRQDLSLQRMLRARGSSAWGLVFAEFAAWFANLMALVLVLLLGATAFLGGKFPLAAVLLRIVPVVLMVASLSYMLNCIAADLTGGLVLQFFTVLALCFVSGCLYPVYMFPVGVQQAAARLPAGIARSLLSGAITGQGMGLLPVWLLGYTLVFFLVGGFVTARRIREVEG